MDEKREFAGGTVTDANTYSKYYKERYELNGTPKGYNLESLVRDPHGHINEIIGLSKYYYNKNGLIMRVVNIIRDFGIGRFQLNYPTQHQRTKKVIEAFNKRINIDQVTKDILFELTLTGNCAGYNRDGQRIDIYPISRVEVSPLIIDNKPVLIYKNDLYTEMTNFAEKELDLRTLYLSYPKEVADGIKAGKDKIVLDVNKSFFDKTNSSRYEATGVTFLLPAFDELAHKNILKEAERATATGIIEKILKISVGDKDHPPSQTEIDFYGNLITGKKGSLKITVPYFVGLEWIEPDTSVFGADKFEQVDKDLLSALGVSLTLIRGEGGGNYSEGIISIAGLIKSIESIRSNIPNMINDWYVQELKRNGIDPKNAPQAILPRVEIDSSARLELMQWLFEHAGLPYQALYEEHGYDFTNVKLLREHENDEKIEDTFSLRQQPFQGSGESGAPTKNLNDRKTDPSKSNNENPRTKTVKKT